MGVCEEEKERERMREMIRGSFASYKVDYETMNSLYYSTGEKAYGLRSIGPIILS